MQKFKNPSVNNQYKKPACHTDYCFARFACCNNYRCCVCHCCLDEYSIYDPVKDSCVHNATKSSLESTASTLAAANATTRLLSTEQQNSVKTQASTMAATTTTHSPKTSTERRKHIATTKHSKNKNGPDTKSSTTLSHGAKHSVLKMTTVGYKSTTKYNKDAGSKNLGRRPQHNDKTSTVAGVAVAMALVAIVAIIVVVVVCSKKRKKKRKAADTLKTKCRVEGNGVVLVPATLENVAEDSCRDTEDATTSDTTVDSTINPTQDRQNVPNGRRPNRYELSPSKLIKEPKNINRKHRKSRDSKCKEEQKPLYKEPAGHITRERNNVVGGMQNTGAKSRNGNAVCYHHHRHDENEVEKQHMHGSEGASNSDVKICIHDNNVRDDSSLSAS